MAAMNKAVLPTEAAKGAISDFAFASRSAARFEPEAVVCVLTFRRPGMLRQTLQSLAAQVGGPRFAVLVVDNDKEGRAGLPIAASFFASGALEGLCVVEEQAGNCRAANRAFCEARRRFASARYILMIDDDEIADPEWVALMVAAACEKNVDIVGGPVVPKFPDNTPDEIAGHPIYWPAFQKSGPVPMIYGSGNFLIRREAFARLENPDFDLRYNFLGGGDTDFFTRCRRAGLSFYWEHDARIIETVPPDRLQVRWILRRGLRIGAINYHIDHVSSRSLVGRLWLLAKNGALIPVSAFRSLRLALQRKPPLVVAHPLIIAAGRVLASIGVQPEQYRFKKTGRT